MTMSTREARRFFTVHLNNGTAWAFKTCAVSPKNNRLPHYAQRALKRAGVPIGFSDIDIITSNYSGCLCWEAGDEVSRRCPSQREIGDQEAARQVAIR